MNNIDITKFPYSKPRKTQSKILDIMDKHWDDYKYFVCEFPTGIGKSALAKTICASVNNGFIITATKQLQDQYVKEFNDGSVVSIKGKANYPCNLNTRLNCETGYCIADKGILKDCKQNNVCKYYNLRDRALSSNIALTSYQYFFRAIDCAGFWKPRNVIIFDECHLLETQLVEWASIKLSPKELVEKYNITENCNMQDFCLISMSPTQSGYKANKKWIETMLRLILNKRDEKFMEIRASLSLNSVNPNNITDEEYDLILTTHKGYYELDKFYKKLEVFMHMNTDEWIIDPYEDGLELTPINIREIFHIYVKKMAIDKIIFMSATILDLSGFRKSLGLPREKTLLLKSDSEFDPKKSPIMYKPICKMNYNEINNNLDKIANEVKNIINNHPDEKGIIHTGNSRVSKYLQDNIKSDRLLVRYGDVTNDKIVTAHSKSKKPTILVSSSLSEGVDLKDDLGRFQIIVKLPWKSLADKRVNIKSKSGNWYAVEMFKSLIQQCGRSTRNEDDYSTTYILDSSFEWWVNHFKNKGWFGKQFLKRIKWR